MRKLKVAADIVNSFYETLKELKKLIEVRFSDISCFQRILRH